MERQRAFVLAMDGARLRNTLFFYIVLLAFRCHAAPSAVECFQTYSNTSGVVCPAACPTISDCEALSGSTVRCVRPKDCSILHTGGVDVNGTCVECSLSGCTTCASATVCGTCRGSFELEGGACVWRSYTLWRVAFIIVGLLLAWIVIEAVVMCLRPVTNKEALQAGLEHRALAKVRDESLPDRPPYAFLTPMHTSSQVCGPGLPLFLNWFCLVIAVSLWLFILAIIFMPSDSTFYSLNNVCSVLVFDHTSKTFDVDAELASQEDDVSKLWVGLSYFGALLMSGVFLHMQNGLWRQLNASSANRPLLHLYALEAHGFPRDATSHTEVAAYWHTVLETLNFAVDGIAEISIAYDFSEKADSVRTLIDYHLEEQLSLKWQTVAPTGEPDASDEIRQSDASGNAASARSLLRAAEPQTVHCGGFWTRAISWLMCGTDFELFGWTLKGGSATTKERISNDDREELLRGMPCSGLMIVVFKTVMIRESVRSSVTMPVKFRGEHEIRVEKFLEEPQGVLWENFGVTRKTKRWRILIMVMVMPVSLALWVLLYWPWSEFTKSAVGTNNNYATAADYLTSMGIPVGNAFIGYIVSYLAAFYGFRRSGHYWQWYLRLIVPCLFINTLSDLYVTYRNSVAILNPELSGSKNFLVTFGLRSIENDMFALLFPGYALVPYIGEPFCTVLVPFLVGTWRMKQDPRITPEYAERILEPGEVDIVNPPYGDLIVSSSTFLVTFLAPGRQHYKIFGAYLIFAVFLYCQNRYRILRWQSMTYFGTNDLHVTETYLWGLPLGILAAAFAARFGSTAEMTVGLGVGAFVLHNVFHYIFARCYLFRQPVVDRQSTAFSYSHALSRCNVVLANYRNTNPIEVLKSQYLPVEVRSSPETPTPENAPLTFYKWGKTHLQPAVHVPGGLSRDPLLGSGVFDSVISASRMPDVTEMADSTNDSSDALLPRADLNSF